MRVALIAILIFSATPALSNRVDAHDRSRSLRLSDSLEKAFGDQGGAPALRWLLQVQVRASGLSAQGVVAANSRQDATTLPDLPSYVRSRACHVLCDKVGGATASCRSSCRVKAMEFDCPAHPPQATGSTSGEYYADMSCSPVADVNVVGMPTFEEFDIRRDDYIDWREMALYAHLLCIPVEGMADMFHAFDLDQNALVSGAEWNAYGSGIHAESEGAPTTTTTTTTEINEAFFVDLEREWGLSAPDFDGLDLDDDGRLQPYEFAGGFMERIVLDHPDMSPIVRGRIYQEISHEMFNAVDTNHDYFVSKQEYETAHAHGLMDD